MKFRSKTNVIILMLFFLMLLFNNNMNNKSIQNKNINFDSNSTVMIPNYKNVFLNHYQTKYKLIYSTGNTINQSK